jgi:hypothetical protein
VGISRADIGVDIDVDDEYPIERTRKSQSKPEKYMVK